MHPLAAVFLFLVSIIISELVAILFATIVL